ncbi:hypothetical protein MKX01_011370 [Papaver californicum]|nr:hypothetical protein MKX01_011370 [Papaver californicum]
MIFAEGTNGLNSDEKENNNNGKEDKNAFSNFNSKYSFIVALLIFILITLL